MCAGTGPLFDAKDIYAAPQHFKSFSAPQQNLELQMAKPA